MKNQSKMEVQFNYYRLRAETTVDLIRLFSLMNTNLNIEYFGEDNSVLFQSKYTIEQIRDYCRLIPDGHVMLQTVETQDDYTGERNWALE